MLHFAEPRYSAFKRFAILAKPCRRANGLRSRWRLCRLTDAAYPLRVFRLRIDMERSPHGAPRRGELPEYTQFSTLDTRYDED